MPEGRIALITDVPKWRYQEGAGALFAARGNGDPLDAARRLRMDLVVGPAPNQVTATVARCVKFRLPMTLSSATMRLLTDAATTGIYRFAVYPAAPGSSRVFDSGTVTTVADSILSVSMTGVTLSKDTDYWFCMGVGAAGTITAAFRSPAAPLSQVQYGSDASPSFLSGKGIGIPEVAQFAVTSGALATAGAGWPATLPAIAAAAYANGTTGSVPIAFFEGTAAQ